VFSRIFAGRNIRKIGVANGSIRVPLEHGVDSLSKLHRVGLIDATGVNPSIFQIILNGLLATSHKLDLPRSSFRDATLLNIAKGYLVLVISPSV
jgi:hypothetical protein